MDTNDDIRAIVEIVLQFDQDNQQQQQQQQPAVPVNDLEGQVGQGQVDQYQMEPIHDDQDPVDHPQVDPIHIDHSPVDPNPIDHNPVDPNPIDHSLVDPIPIDRNPVDPILIDHNPVDPIPIDHNPIAQNQIAQNQITQNQITQNQITQNQLTQNQLTQNQITQNQITQNQITHYQIANNQITHNQFGHIQAGHHQVDYRRLTHHDTEEQIQFSYWEINYRRQRPPQSQPHQLYQPYQQQQQQYQHHQAHTNPYNRTVPPDNALFQCIHLLIMFKTPASMRQLLRDPAMVTLVRHYHTNDRAAILNYVNMVWNMTTLHWYPSSVDNIVYHRSMNGVYVELYDGEPYYSVEHSRLLISRLLLNVLLCPKTVLSFMKLLREVINRNQIEPETNFYNNKRNTVYLVDTTQQGGANLLVDMLAKFFWSTCVAEGSIDEADGANLVNTRLAVIRNFEFTQEKINIYRPLFEGAEFILGGHRVPQTPLLVTSKYSLGDLQNEDHRLLFRYRQVTYSFVKQPWLARLTAKPHPVALAFLFQAKMEHLINIPQNDYFIDELHPNRDVYFHL